MNSPFLSVIIPTLNEEQYIPKLLKDLEKQKEKNFEIIVVDSHSKDHTKNSVQQFNNLPLQFFQINQENVSIQRNYGAKHSKGKYLVFLDADARVSSIFTRKLEKNILKKKGLFFVPMIVTEETTAETQAYADITNFFLEISQYSGRPIALGSGMIFEKNYFFTIGRFDERLSFGEDYELAQRSLKWGVRAKFLREVPITFSLRRIQREGRLKAFYKFFLSSVQYLIKGKTERKIFTYEMGGHLYKNMNKKKTPYTFNTALKKAKKTLLALLEE